jgi:hypothetical protein
VGWPRFGAAVVATALLLTAPAGTANAVVPYTNFGEIRPVFDGFVDCLFAHPKCLDLRRGRVRQQ